MNVSIESLDFPSEIKKKLKTKVSTANLKFEFLSGHIIKFNKTNLSVTEPHRIIVSNSNKVLYDDSKKVYLPNNNAIISFTKFINILNVMNKI